jgi:two-component system cell cycle response regulator
LVACRRSSASSKRAEEELLKAKDALEQLALQDPLTGLPNRRRFTIGFEHELARSKRPGTTLSLLLRDIDHFKTINDSKGHLTGDVCLKEVANVFRASARDADLEARFGGDEFVMLLPDTPAPQALVVAERMCSKVQSETSVTISIGAATAIAEAGPPTLKDLSSQADEAAYRAKRSGRNRASA